MIVGLTSGCFDLFHHSHLLFLENCKSRCDKLIVGVDSNKLVSSRKGPNRPVHNETHRVNLLNSLSVIDVTFILRYLEQLDTIAVDFNVDEVYKCGKFNDGRRVHGTNFAKLVIMPDIVGMVSTTDIIKRIKEDNLPVPIVTKAFL